MWGISEEGVADYILSGRNGVIYKEILRRAERSGVQFAYECSFGDLHLQHWHEIILPSV